MEDVLFLMDHSTLSELKLSCRLCLCPDQEVDLFSTLQANINFYHILAILMDIEDNNEFPQKICVECASKLILFHKFRKKCIHSQSTLAAALHKPIKEENSIEREKPGATDEAETHNIQQNDESSLGSEEYIEEEQPLLPLTCQLDNTDVLEQESCELVFNTEILNCSKVIETAEEELNIDAENIVEEEYLEASVVLPQQSQEPTEKPKAKTKSRTQRQCEYCDRIFSRKSTLDLHRQTHTGIKNFSCQLCSTKFTRKAHLQIHLRIHNNIKPYTCDLCNKAFVKSGDLLRHKRIHSDERNYSCEKCNKTFKRSSDVTTHQRTHTGLKPYSCKLCSKAYASHSGLKKHKLKSNHQ